MRRQRLAVGVWPALADVMAVFAVVSLLTTLYQYAADPGNVFGKSCRFYVE